jgi:SAM-dependent methyltransferase
MQLDQLVVQYVLGDAALSKYLQGDLPQQQLAAHAACLRELSDWYVGPRNAPFEIGAAHARAYALYYLLLNARKWRWLCRQVLAELLPKSALRILDFGAGPGTASLALLEAQLQVAEVHVVESSSAMRELALALLTAAGCASVRAERSLQQGAPPAEGRYELVIFSNVLNELSTPERLQLLLYTGRLLSPGGIIAIMEPALQEQTRALMLLRDQFLADASDFAVRYPCLRQDACPMLQASARDWCHTTLQAEAPPIVRQLDQLTGFNKHRLKLSCMLFQRGPRPLQPSSAYRLMEDSERGRRGVEALACGACDYGRLLVPRKQRSQQTLAFEKGRSFDSLLVDQQQGSVTAAQPYNALASLVP